MTNDDSITLTLPRHEVAALVLHHLNEADLYEREVDNGHADPTDVVRWRFSHLQRVEELDGHMTDELREWVTKRRDEECKRLLTETVQTFLNDASNKQIRAIYDLTLALKMRAANKAANPLVDEEKD